MSIQAVNYNKSKKELAEALNTHPDRVYFYNPSMFGSHTSFRGHEIRVGERFPVVMDHPKRNRFAEIKRVSETQFKVL